MADHPTDTPALLPPLFGVNIDPGVGNLQEAFARARLADDHGLDLIGVQDHPTISIAFSIHDSAT
jgi:hypothetical protein